jgi:MoaA/NifB/PqqE/SkfB family radical SAM enzyme
MSMETFERVLDVAGDYGMNIFLGGGEPTLHPHFATFVALSLGVSEGAPGVVTNGTSSKRIFHMLEALEAADMFYVGLSDPEDGYHDKTMMKPWWLTWGMDPSVPRPGSRLHRPSNISALGRAKHRGADEWEVHTYYDMLITPRGTIYCCEWKHRSFGNIHTISDEELGEAVSYCAEHETARDDYFKRKGLVG